MVNLGCLQKALSTTMMLPKLLLTRLARQLHCAWGNLYTNITPCGNIFMENSISKLTAMKGTFVLLILRSTG